MMINAMVDKFLQDNERVLQRLTDFMLDYNKKVNLTRIVELDEIREKHYIDSILPLILYDVPRGTSVLDVGSGAGFPGILMKLYRPDLCVTLLDSSRKRTDYLKLLLDEIDVECSVVTARSEELAHEINFRERYDFVTARAVANLSALCEYCLPFVKLGGVFLSMKGENDETASALNSVSILGGEIQNIVKYALPSGDNRRLVVIKKIRQTPTKYPRKRVNITKLPIE